MTPMVSAIVEATAALFGVGIADLLGERRCREFAVPRMVAMWVALETSGYSTTRLGRCFRRDHTTVMSARRRVDALRRCDPFVHAATEALRCRFADEVAARNAALLAAVTAAEIAPPPRPVAAPADPAKPGTMRLCAVGQCINPPMRGESVCWEHGRQGRRT